MRGRPPLQAVEELRQQAEEPRQLAEAEGPPLRRFAFIPSLMFPCLLRLLRLTRLSRLAHRTWVSRQVLHAKIHCIGLGM